MSGPFRSPIVPRGVLCLLLLGTVELGWGQTIDEFAIPTATANPFGIAAGPDGNVWFTESYGLKVGKITPSGAITEYTLPTNQGALAITAGPDGALWFVHGLARVTTAGAVTSYAVAGGGQFIAAGADGNLWITENNKLARVSPSSPSTVTEYPVPSSVSTLGGITAGPDGNVWFTETDHSGNAARVARIDLSKLNGCGTGPLQCITEWVIPGQDGGSGLTGIAAGPDNAVWFTSTGKVNRISMTGTITQYTAASASTQGGIAKGSDGAMWFAGNGKIGRVTTAGAVTEIQASSGFTSPRGLAAGPDGNIWFVEINAQKIGRVNLAGAPPTATPGGSTPTPTPGAGTPTPTHAPPASAPRGHVTPLPNRTPLTHTSARP